MKSVLRRSRYALIMIAAAMIAAACTGDTPTGTVSPQGAPLEPPGDPIDSPPWATVRAPELGTCSNLTPPAGSVVTFRTYATGVQIYSWNGTAWSFVAPEADLFIDAGLTARFGTHYAGPTWQTVNGGRVIGAVAERCTPNAAAIQWLLLDVVADSGKGLLRGTTHIQRVNTVAGLAPSAPGDSVGHEVRVPYTTDYYFYRAP